MINRPSYNPVAFARSSSPSGSRRRWRPVVPATLKVLPPRRIAADQAVKTLADAYLAGYFDRHPEQLTVFGVPGSHHDRLTDNSLDALKAWEAREDGWLEQARAIRASEITNASIRATYAIVREALESDVGARVCRNELWNVSQMTGWQVNDGYLVTIQPVDRPTRAGSARAVADAAALHRHRHRQLREASRSAGGAKLIVLIMIDQVNTLAELVADSPFMSPVQRTGSPVRGGVRRARVEGARAGLHAIRGLPAASIWRRARGDRGVGQPPGRLLLRRRGSRSQLAAGPGGSHDLALANREPDRRMKPSRAVVPYVRRAGVDAETQSDPQFLFKNRDDLIIPKRRLRARRPCRRFNMKPNVDVRIEPYPKFREKSAPNRQPAGRGRQPRRAVLHHAYQARRRAARRGVHGVPRDDPRAPHADSIALERKGIHPVGSYYLQQWLRRGMKYAERLADEMKLYSGDLDHLGCCRAGVSRRAVGQTQTIRWGGAGSRRSTTCSPIPRRPRAISSRKWIATSSGPVGDGLHARHARDPRRPHRGGQALDRFDIKTFHDKILEDGAVPDVLQDRHVGRVGAETIIPGRHTSRTKQGSTSIIAYAGSTPQYPTHGPCS